MCVGCTYGTVHIYISLSPPTRVQHNTYLLSLWTSCFLITLPYHLLFFLRYLPVSTITYITFLMHGWPNRKINKTVLYRTNGVFITHGWRYLLLHYYTTQRSNVSYEVHLTIDTGITKHKSPPPPPIGIWRVAFICHLGTSISKNGRMGVNGVNGE